MILRTGEFLMGGGLWLATEVVSPVGRKGIRLGLAEDEDHAGFLEHGFEGLEKFGGGRAVDDAVVGAEGEREHVADDDLAVADDGALLGGADGEDGDLGRIDDGAEFADAEGAQVADGEGRAGHLVLLEACDAGAVDEINAALADFAEAHEVDVAEDGDDEAIGDGDGDAEIDVAIAGDLGAVEGGVKSGVTEQCGGDRLGEKIGEAEADFLGFEHLVEASANLH